MVTLQYFFNGMPDVEIVGLLDRVATMQAIEVRMDDLSDRGQYDPGKNREVYDVYFKPRAKVLKRRTGQSITGLRSNSGRYFVAIPGTLAVLHDGEVAWFEIGKDDILRLLFVFLRDGPGALETLRRPFSFGDHASKSGSRLLREAFEDESEGADNHGAAEKTSR